MITKRLQVLASLVHNPVAIYDIGCDHGRLLCYLKKQYPSIPMVGSDIKEHIIQKASANAISCGYPDITFICSDGFANLTINEGSTVIIAGMGAHRILNILSHPSLCHIQTLIIQSNNKHAFLRQKLVNLGFSFMEERVVYEKYFYVLMVLQQKRKQYLKKELLLGPILKSKKDLDTIAYYKYCYRKENTIYQSLPRHMFIKRCRQRQVVNHYKRVINDC